MKERERPTERVIAGWIGKLDSPSEEERLGARLKLEALGRAAAAPFFRMYGRCTAGQRLEMLDLLGLVRSAYVSRRAGALFQIEDDARLRASLVTLIGRCGGHRDIPMLAKALHDRDKRVRANAVESLAQIGGRDIIRFLVPLLRDSNNRVRANTARALWEFDDQRDLVREAFEGMVGDASKWMRASALYAFGEMGVMDFFHHLLQSIDEEDEDVARNAVVALVGYAEKHDEAARGASVPSGRKSR